MSSDAAGRLPMVHLPAEGDARRAALRLARPGARLTLIYSHGNAEDLRPDLAE